MVNPVVREFISEEVREFRFQIGRILASSLTGFIAGVIFSSIVWMTMVYIYKTLS